MAAAKKREKQGKHGTRARRRTRKMAAAAGAMLLVPAVVSHEPTSLAKTGDLSALDGAGGGLMGLTDPDSVNADGTLSESDQIGADVLRDAGNPTQLGLEGLDLPSGPLGIPGIMLDAYKKAEAALAKQQPNCHLSWALLASIGRIESAHARGGQVFANGDTANPILGPVLNGGGFAAIADTDAGRYDGDSRWDRAVGAMQFIPSTWATYASDGNGDRIASPHNVFDAALAAGKYLCSGGLNLADPQQQAAAVFRYNHSDTYVRVVLIWADAYLKGVTPIPSTPLPAVPPMQQAVVAPPEPVSPGTDGTQTPPPANSNNPANPQNPNNPPNPQDPSNPTDPSCTPTSTTSTTTSTTDPTSTTPTPPNCETSTTSSSTTTTTTTTTTTQAPAESSSSSGGSDTSTGGAAGSSSLSSSTTTTTTTTTETTPSSETTSPSAP